MRHSFLSFCIAGVWLIVGGWLMATPAYADGVIIVTTTVDGVSDDNACALREAILAANSDSAVGGCPSGAGKDTITIDPVLPHPVIFTLTQSGPAEDGAQSGDLDISGSLTLNPGGAAIVIDGNGSDRVFDLRSGAQVTMTGVTIRNGNPGEGANGGGIMVNLTARLTMTASQVISNRALYGGGIQTLGRLTLYDSLIARNQGGGIHNDGGLVMLRTSTVADNRGGYGLHNQQLGALTMTGGAITGNQGGGLYNHAATATLSSLAVSSNTGGSGVYNTGVGLTRLTITASVLLSNTGVSGGGLFNDGIGAKAQIYASRISGNQATNGGGGLFNNGLLTLAQSTVDHNQAHGGGGLYHFGGLLTLTNNTISQNQASDNGGGIYNGSDALLKNNTIAANGAAGAGGNLFNDEAEWSASNTIVAQAQAGANCVNSNGFLKSLGHNLEDVDSCQFRATGDLTNTNPLLSPLQENGGPTPTQALLVGSPAIDHGADCPATDQRGVIRPQGGACDIGAYEFAPSADLGLTATVIPTLGATGERLTYTLRISNQGPFVADALILSDTLPAGVTFITATISNGHCDAVNLLTCTVTTLAPGLTLTATLAVTAPQSAGTLTNTATITAATPDLLPGNNRSVMVSTIYAPVVDLIPPGPVPNLTATLITTNGATLNWTPASDNVGVVGYRVYAQVQNAGQQPFLVGQVAGDITTYGVTTLAAYHTYQLWVSAFDRAGNQPAITDNATVQFTTLRLPVSAFQISLTPPLPTDHDPISITVAGQHSNSCVPDYQAHARIDHLITITSTASTADFCLPAESPWGYTLGLGPLAIGQYTVNHRLTQVVTTINFTVTAAVSSTAPSFPSDGSSPPTALVGTPFQYTVRASGTPPLTYTLVQGPPGMTIEAATGRLTWIPTAVLAGLVAITVRASNHWGHADYTFHVTVQRRNSGGLQFFLPLVTRR